MTSLLGFGLAGWFGFVLGIVIWLALRLFMYVRPWPPGSSSSSSTASDRSVPRP